VPALGYKIYFQRISPGLRLACLSKETSLLALEARLMLAVLNYRDTFTATLIIFNFNADFSKRFYMRSVRRCDERESEIAQDCAVCSRPGELGSLRSCGRVPLQRDTFRFKRVLI